MPYIPIKYGTCGKRRYRSYDGNGDYPFAAAAMAVAVDAPVDADIWHGMVGANVCLSRWAWR
ncbi:transposase and inactivated derivative [Paenibacillus popilliae ATCC 14706]|uniref:Transposase and inactivated derivative n=1 Tax=Paenibacillus popilliae ATCC 14706 TaxID=1212764 RepID=M9LC60_PAEPP|nr:transposase and inactivated derivative [Paenibacillus popilliae ATCC 14706]